MDPDLKCVLCQDFVAATEYDLENHITEVHADIFSTAVFPIKKEELEEDDINEAPASNHLDDDVQLASSRPSPELKTTPIDKGPFLATSGELLEAHSAKAHTVKGAKASSRSATPKGPTPKRNPGQKRPSMPDEDSPPKRTRNQDGLGAAAGSSQTQEIGVAPVTPEGVRKGSENTSKPGRKSVSKKKQTVATRLLQSASGNIALSETGGLKQGSIRQAEADSAEVPDSTSPDPVIVKTEIESAGENQTPAAEPKKKRTRRTKAQMEEFRKNQLLKKSLAATTVEGLDSSQDQDSSWQEPSSEKAESSLEGESASPALSSTLADSPKEGPDSNEPDQTIKTENESSGENQSPAVEPKQKKTRRNKAQMEEFRKSELLKKSLAVKKAQEGLDSSMDQDSSILDQVTIKAEDELVQDNQPPKEANCNGTKRTEPEMDKASEIKFLANTAQATRVSEAKVAGPSASEGQPEPEVTLKEVDKTVPAKKKNSRKSHKPIGNEHLDKEVPSASKKVCLQDNLARQPEEQAVGLNEERNEAETIETDFAKLKSEFDRLESENRQLRSETEKTEELRAELDKVIAENEILRSEQKNFEATEAEFKTSQMKFVMYQKTALAEIKTLKSELAQAKADNERLEQMFKASEDEKYDLEKRIAALVSRLGVETQKFRKANKDSIMLMQQQHFTKKALFDKNVEIVELKKTITDLKCEIIDLKSGTEVNNSVGTNPEEMAQQDFGAPLPAQV